MLSRRVFQTGPEHYPWSYLELTILLFLAIRPPSPPVDNIQEKYVNTSKLTEDFSIALRGCELADVIFLVGEERIPLYGVKAILACRSRYGRVSGG